MTHKPICLVNLDGYFDGFLQQMHRSAADGILYGAPESFFHSENDGESALKWCLQEIASSLRDGNKDSLNRNGNDLSSKRVINRSTVSNNNWSGRAVSALAPFLVGFISCYFLSSFRIIKLAAK